MKILSFLNISNLSNLEADSGYVLQRSVLEELYRRFHQVVLIGPYGMPNLGEEIISVEVDFSHSKYGVRFGLNWEELRTKLMTVIDGVDVLLVNQSELAVQLSVLMYELTGKKIPCVTYYHYLAVQDCVNGKIAYDPSLDWCGVAKNIWQRQIESAEFSDVIAIGSEYGKNLFLEASGNDSSIDKKFLIIPPPVKSVKKLKRLASNNIPVICYNHRLYDHYGSMEIFTLLEELNQTIPFKLVVTDPTQKRSIIREKLDTSIKQIKQYLGKLSFVELRHFETQHEYYEALNKMDIGLAPFRNGALWSMATADVMAVGKPVVAPNKGPFMEIIQDADLLFDSPENFKVILSRLLLDAEYRKEKGDAAFHLSNKLKIGNIGHKFEQALLMAIKKGA